LRSLQASLISNFLQSARLIGDALSGASSKDKLCGANFFGDTSDVPGEVSSRSLARLQREVE
jgi:hypothetical protein